MALKSGRVADFGGSLAEAMELAMKAEWQAVKGFALPEQGVDDRRLLFVAFARGLFDYLKANEDALITRVTLREDVPTPPPDQVRRVTQLELNL